MKANKITLDRIRGCRCRCRWFISDLLPQKILTHVCNNHRHVYKNTQTEIL